MADVPVVVVFSSVDPPLDSTMRLLSLFVLVALVVGSLGEETKVVAKPKRKWCNTTVHGLAGDYAYEACGSAPC